MTYGNQTDLGGSRNAFLTTQWSLIDKIKAGEDVDQTRIGFLLEQYWKPVYCFLRRKGYANEPAKDLTQGFFHEVVLNQDLVQHADQNRGRFRSFLLRALIRFISKQNKNDRAQKRIPPEKLIPLEQIDTLCSPESVSQSSSEATFHHAWLSTLLERVLESVRASFENEGMEKHWTLFYSRVIGPILYDQAEMSLGDLCEIHQIKDAKTASNMIITVKRRYRSALLDQVGKTVLSPGQAPEELADLMTYFPRGARPTASIGGKA